MNPPLLSIAGAIRLLACLCAVLAAAPTAAQQRPDSAAARVARARTHAAAPTLSAYQLRHGWFSRDKGYHFAISAAGSGGLYLAGRRLGLARWKAVGISAGVMGAAGLLREIANADPSDLLTRQHFSRKDLVWDAAGIAAGISLTDLLYRRREAGRAEPVPVPPPPADQPAG